jgi:hypothetical protein
MGELRRRVIGCHVTGHHVAGRHVTGRHVTGCHHLHGISGQNRETGGGRPGGPPHPTGPEEARVEIPQLAAIIQIQRLTGMEIT